MSLSPELSIRYKIITLLPIPPKQSYLNSSLIYPKKVKKSLVWNKYVVSPLSCHLFSPNVGIGALAVSSHILHVSHIVLSVAVKHFTKNEIVMLKLSLADRSRWKREFSFPMHLEISIYEAFVHSTVLVDDFAGSNRCFSIPDSADSAFIDQVWAMSPFSSHFESPYELLPWRFSDDARSVSLPQEPLSFVHTTIRVCIFAYSMPLVFFDFPNILVLP